MYSGVHYLMNEIMKTIGNSIPLHFCKYTNVFLVITQIDQPDIYG